MRGATQELIGPRCEITPKVEIFQLVAKFHNLSCFLPSFLQHPNSIRYLKVLPVNEQEGGCDNSSLYWTVFL